MAGAEIVSDRKGLGESQAQLRSRSGTGTDRTIDFDY